MRSDTRRDETQLEAWRVTLARQAGDVVTILTRAGLRLTGKLLDATPSGLFVGLLDVYTPPDELAGLLGDDAPALAWALIPWCAVELVTDGHASDQEAAQAERLAHWRARQTPTP